MALSQHFTFDGETIEISSRIRTMVIRWSISKFTNQIKYRARPFRVQLVQGFRVGRRSTHVRDISAYHRPPSPTTLAMIAGRKQDA